MAGSPDSFYSIPSSFNKLPIIRRETTAKATEEKVSIDFQAPAHPDVISEALSQGYTLPATWYTDPTIFDRERERIFRSPWQYGGHVDQVREPGQFVTLRICDVPVIVV